MRKKKDKSKKIENLLDLGVLMEITRSTLKLPDTDQNPTIGIKGLKRQLKEAETRFPDKPQMLLFYAEIEPNLNYNPEDENDAPIDIVIKSVWVNRKTKNVVNEPRWWKKVRENQSFTSKIEGTQTPS